MISLQSKPLQEHSNKQNL